jgi:SAM-dependent methyltransferase
MTDQAESWSRVARRYEKEFIDPYRAGVRSPLLARLKKVAARGKVAADLGCGIGPLLPELAARFRHVYAVDFAPGMLDRARERCRGLNNITYVHSPLDDLQELSGKIDVAVAVNSLVMPSVAEQDRCLGQILAALRPKGSFLGILPAMDSVHYYTMLLLDRALAGGKPMSAARKNAAHFNDHALYDFAFGQFRFEGIEQHFWQPFEVRYRLRKAGFRGVRLQRVLLDWAQFSWGEDFKRFTPPWDWYLEARRPENHPSRAS